MADLSPSAQAVLDAFSERHEFCGPFDGNWQELCLAAALRAAADQVVPEKSPHPLANSPEAKELFNTPEEWMYEGIEQDARQDIRRRLLAIAAELEGR